MDRKEMKCTLFSSESSNPNAPKLKALATINGIEYELAFWLAVEWKDGLKTDTPKLTKSGKKYYTGSVKMVEPAEEQEKKPAPDDEIQF